MGELTIGEKQIRVRATPLALLFYRQEFNADLLGELTKMQGLEKDMAKIDSVFFLKLTWAMAKADAGLDSEFPSFLKWVNSLESFDFSDTELMSAVMEEAANGFFRRSRQAQIQKRSQRRTRS